LWHDHEQEIATGRAQVHDLPPDKAKEVADLVATTDGIIFHLWSHDDKVPEWQSDDRAIGGTREPYASRVEEGCSEERGGKGVLANNDILCRRTKARSCRSPSSVSIRLDE